MIYFPFSFIIGPAKPRASHKSSSCVVFRAQHRNSGILEYFDPENILNYSKT